MVCKILCGRNDYEVETLHIKFSDSFHQLRKINLFKIVLFFKLFLKLRSKINSFGPDIMYFSFMPIGKGLLRDVCYLLYAKNKVSEVVLHIHNRGVSVLSKKKLYRILYRWAFKRTHIIHLSDSLFKTEFQSLSLQNVRHHIIPNTFYPSKNNPTEKTKIRKEGSIRILFLSNLLEEKGVFIALETIKILSNKQRGLYAYQLDIYGQEYRKGITADMHSYIKKNKLEGVAAYHGPVYGREKDQAYNKAHIFLFPSYFSEESMPLSVLEAMQKGLSIIASDIGAIGEMLDHGKAGVLIDQIKPEEFAKSILNLTKKPGDLERIGENAKIHFEKRYSFDRFKKNILNMMDMVAGKQ